MLYLQDCTCFSVNLNRVSLLLFDVIDKSDSKATSYFIIIINTTTCGNPFVVVNFGHRETNGHPIGYAMLVRSM